MEQRVLTEIELISQLIVDLRMVLEYLDYYQIS